MSYTIAEQTNNLLIASDDHDDPPQNIQLHHDHPCAGTPEGRRLSGISVI